MRRIFGNVYEGGMSNRYKEVIVGCRCGGVGNGKTFELAEARLFRGHD
jgi:hypothetical protein